MLVAKEYENDFTPRAVFVGLLVGSVCSEVSFKQALSSAVSYCV